MRLLLDLSQVYHRPTHNGMTCSDLFSNTFWFLMILFAVRPQSPRSVRGPRHRLPPHGHNSSVPSKSALEEHYTVAMDWTGSLFCGINLDSNYPKCIVTMNMPQYVTKALLKFQHPTPVSPQHPARNINLTKTFRYNMVQKCNMSPSTHPNPSLPPPSNESNTSSERFCITDASLTLPFSPPSAPLPPAKRKVPKLLPKLANKFLTRGHSPQHRHPLQRLQHDSRYSHRCIIPLGTGGQEPRSRTFLPYQQGR